MSLYLKYRPLTVEELDLTSVREALGKIIKSNQVAHAYLFTGPRGAGKTSSARILARIVNCEKNKDKLGEPCNDCDACRAILSGSSLDFVEIDAASNRGIDDIRELKDKIRLAPSQLKYKVYIIDEVHMLTTEAFNALLKTLEEPPAHSIFILCTTETHKVPETIVSRCVRIGFGKATQSEMVRSFERVVKGEQKKVEQEALSYLAKNVDGSFRDGVKVLDLVLANNEQVGLAEMEAAVMGSSGYKIEPLTHALATKDLTQSLGLLHEATIQGVELLYLTVSIMKGLRDQLLSGGERELTKLVFKLDEVARKLPISPVPELLLEMVIIDWCDGSDIPKINPEPSKAPTEVSRPAKKQDKPDKIDKPDTKVQEMGDHRDVWNKLTQSLNGDSITLGALLSKAQPAQLSGDTLTIQVAYPFHREQIMSERVLSKLEPALERAVGRRIRVVCQVVAGSEPATGTGANGDDNDTIDEAVAIFSS